MDPAATLSLDPVLLARFPVGYRHLGYLQVKNGFKVKSGLPGLTGEAVTRLYGEGARWAGRLPPLQGNHSDRHRGGRRGYRWAGRRRVHAPGRATATVYEQASALGDLGAGLVVAPNAARLLRRLPSESGLERAGVVLESGWEFRRWADGSVLFAQQLGEMRTRQRGHTWTMHRTDLLEVLRSAVPDEAIKLGRRCTGVTQDDGGVTLTFSSGSPVRADVVVAADGIHSVLREHVTTTSLPRKSGLCAWRWLVPAGLPHRSHGGRCRRCGSATAITWCTTRSAQGGW